MTYASLRGTTLAETVIAVGILALLILALVTGLRTASTAERNVRAIAEVETQAGYVLQQVSQSVRNAQSISSPATSTAASTLTLATSVSGQNPTQFALSSSSVTMSYAGGTAQPLTNANVVVTGLSFQNVSTSTARAVRVTLTLRNAAIATQPELQFARTFYTTVTLR